MYPWVTSGLFLLLCAFCASQISECVEQWKGLAPHVVFVLANDGHNVVEPYNQYLLAEGYPTLAFPWGGHEWANSHWRNDTSHYSEKAFFTCHLAPCVCCYLSAIWQGCLRFVTSLVPELAQFDQEITLVVDSSLTSHCYWAGEYFWKQWRKDEGTPFVHASVCVGHSAVLIPLQDRVSRRLQIHS